MSRLSYTQIAVILIAAYLFLRTQFAISTLLLLLWMIVVIVLVLLDSSTWYARRTSPP